MIPNTSAIYDLMQNKETYATHNTDSNMVPWFFQQTDVSNFLEIRWALRKDNHSENSLHITIELACIGIQIKEIFVSFFSI